MGTARDVGNREGTRELRTRGTCGTSTMGVETAREHGSGGHEGMSRIRKIDPVMGRKRLEKQGKKEVLTVR